MMPVDPFVSRNRAGYMFGGQRHPSTAGAAARSQPRADEHRGEKRRTGPPRVAITGALWPAAAHCGYPDARPPHALATFNFTAGVLW